MYHKRKSGTWWGMLESSKKGDSVVVWDAVLPRASTGKVFLFNTLKGSLVEYVEDIVQPKLRELTAAESRDAHHRYDQAWNEIRAQFVEPEPEDASPDSGVSGDGDDESVEVDDDLPELEEDELGDDDLDIDDDDEFEDL